MGKILYCFKSLLPVQVNDVRAIAQLHPDYDTPENRKEMESTAVRQLLARQAEGLQKALGESNDATKADIDKVLITLADLQSQVNNINTQAPTESTTTPISTSGEVNEYGEII